MKYYWLSCARFNLTILQEGMKELIISEMVTTKHPFIQIAETSKRHPTKLISILSWKEITEEEYNLHIKTIR